MSKENMTKEENENPYIKNLDAKMYLERYADIEAFYDLQTELESMSENQREVLRYMLYFHPIIVWQQTCQYAHSTKGR